jgi:hypothetical protein
LITRLILKKILAESPKPKFNLFMQQRPGFLHKIAIQDPKLYLMKYYKLEHNIADLGACPQDKGIVNTGRYSMYDPDALWDFNFNTNTNGLKAPEGILLRHNAKFIDFMQLNCASFPYLVISDRLLELVLNLKLPAHSITPVKITKRDKAIHYNIFISKAYFAEYLNFNLCQFYTYRFDDVKGPYNRIPVAIPNAQFFWDVLNNTIRPLYFSGTNIVLDTSVIEYDIFRLPNALGIANYIVSEKLAEAVTKAGFTGIQFVPFDAE